MALTVASWNQIVLSLRQLDSLRSQLATEGDIPFSPFPQGYRDGATTAAT